MAIPFLQASSKFPDADSADGMGVVAVGADLKPETLLHAYSKGIFPWFSEYDPYPVWWSPPERMVLIPGEHKESKSMKQLRRQKRFEFSFDEAFETVIHNCAAVYRPDQGGTWITEEMIAAYTELHKLGFAHSAEVWENNRLVGGLYGVSLGGLFCGESMFSLVPNASKFAFIELSERLHKNGFQLIDCQNHTDHLESLGAFLVSRDQYLKKLDDALEMPSIKGKWDF